jgi:hypothetical protein
LDADFQQRYLSAERAYGEGNYPQAKDLSTTLLDELNTAEAEGRSDEALTAWRAVLALLLGHIEFHGFQDPTAAEAHYQRVLSCQPPETLRELAEQGLERCLVLTSEATVPLVASESHGNDLVRDPFLETSPSLNQAAVETPAPSATPWLDGTSINVEPAAAPEPGLDPTEQEAVKPEPAPPKSEPKQSDEPPLIDCSILEGALLRVNLSS